MKFVQAKATVLAFDVFTCHTCGRMNVRPKRECVWKIISPPVPTTRGTTGTIDRFSKSKTIHLLWMTRDGGMVALFEKQVRVCGARDTEI